MPHLVHPTRRDLLRAGALGAAGLTLPHLLRARAEPSETRPRADACILLFLWGAPSQFETFDPKPDAPDGIRGEHGVRRTRLPGVLFGEHIPLLAQHFVLRLAHERGRPPLTIEPEALNLLGRYHWPGNVRELENVIERAMVLAEGDRITARDLPFEGATVTLDVPLPAGHPPLREVVEQVERQLIERALRSAQGNKSEAARLLDLKASVLYYKLEKYGLIDRLKE